MISWWRIHVTSFDSWPTGVQLPIESDSHSGRLRMQIFWWNYYCTGNHSIWSPSDLLYWPWVGLQSLLIFIFLVLVNTRSREAPLKTFNPNREPLTFQNTLWSVPNGVWRLVSFVETSFNQSLINTIKFISFICFQKPLQKLGEMFQPRCQLSRAYAVLDFPKFSKDYVYIPEIAKKRLHSCP